MRRPSKFWVVETSSMGLLLLMWVLVRLFGAWDAAMLPRIRRRRGYAPLTLPRKARLSLSPLRGARVPAVPPARPRESGSAGCRRARRSRPATVGDRDAPD